MTSRLAYSNPYIQNGMQLSLTSLFLPRYTKLYRALALITMKSGDFEGRKRIGMTEGQSELEGAGFLEFRRKMRAAEVLSAAMERLLAQLRFNGKLSVMVQNGRVLKSGYEEGYFRNPSAS